jgi:ATP-dependent Clp protease ATP-binding subunit ClpB
VDFRNTVVIMTSNLGSIVFTDPTGSPEDRREKILAEVRATFRPEFVNRVDDIVVFEPLGRREIAQIVDLQVRQLRERLAGRRLELELTPEAREHLADKGFDPAYGARPLKRVIQREVQDALALRLLAGEIHEGDRVTLDARDGVLVFDSVPA